MAKNEHVKAICYRLEVDNDVISGRNVTRNAHKLWVMAKRNVLKTWNVRQPETHLRLRINSQYKSFAPPATV